MKKRFVQTAALLFALCFVIKTGSAQQLVAAKTLTDPKIDGSDRDKVWKEAQVIVASDPIASISISIQALYSSDKIFFLIHYPDPDESRTHKSWIWDSGREIYDIGNNREDVFVFKWNMTNEINDISLSADTPYKADIWYWKACRTDPVGYADDKIHIYETDPIQDATVLTSHSGNKMFLLRKEDKGKSAYQTNLPFEYSGETQDRYTYRVPTESRADVKAKGQWENGMWTIEFERALQTGHDDDVQFILSKNYKFGLSRYEIAGRRPNSKLSQPLYGTGDTEKLITLSFQQ